MLTAISSCKKKPQLVHTPGYIIGNNNILPLTQASKSSVPEEVLNSAVLISTQVSEKSVKFCSGVLLDNGMETFQVLTNHHCFAKVDPEGRSTSELQETACQQTEVLFGFSELTAFKPEKIGCADGSLRTDPVGDLAILNLVSAPTQPTTRLQLFDGNPDATDRAALVVHHPAVEDRLRSPPGSRIPLPTTSVTTEDCMVKGNFAMQEWHLDPSLAHAVRHNCDLIRGSSGSALVDAETKKILGINWGGIVLTDSQGERTDNAATWVPYIKAFLENNTAAEVSRRQNMITEAQHRAENEKSTAGKKPKKIKEMERKVHKTFCGTLSDLPESKTHFSLTLLLFLLTPMILLFNSINRGTKIDH